MKSGILHHISLRKRIHLEKQKFPHPDKKIRFLDNLVILLAIITPLAMLPQIYKMYFFKVVEGLSPTTFIILTLVSIPWFLYGLVHKDKPLIINNVLLIIVNLIIVVGYFTYI